MIFLKSITFWTLLIVHITGEATGQVTHPASHATHEASHATHEASHATHEATTQAPGAAGGSGTAPVQTTTPAPTSTSAPISTPGLIGSNCVQGSGICTPHATCKNNICQCDTSYYKRSDRTCGLTVGQSCDDTSPCVDHARCEPKTTTPPTTAPLGQTQATKTCECDEDFYKSGDNCTLRLSAGSHCSTNDFCTKNSTCDLTEHVCKCNPNFYKNDTQYCVPRIPPGHPCVLTADGEHNCITGAACYNNATCQCIPYQYKLSQAGDQCIKIKQEGENCTKDSDCLENANCSTMLCRCNTDFYYNNNYKQCQLRKPLGASCAVPDECVANANCTDHRVCECNDNYYDHSQRCNLRLQLNHPCDSAIPKQCLPNGECVHEYCQCNQNSYSDGVICQKTISFDGECDIEISDPRQCISNTTCGYHNGKLKCGCDINHFFNGQYCVRRALAGDTCPYVSAASVGLHMTTAEFQRQCVENANCNQIYEVCECKSGYYDRSGRCPRQIAQGEICDPWTDSPHQCSGNNQCLYGRCVPHQ